MTRLLKSPGYYIFSRSDSILIRFTTWSRAETRLLYPHFFIISRLLYFLELGCFEKMNKNIHRPQQGSFVDIITRSWGYMYVCIHTHINTYVDTQIHTHTYIHTYIHTYMHACMHACIYTYIHTCMHAYMHTCIHTYINTYMHTCITNIHAYVHYMHTCIECIRTGRQTDRHADRQADRQQTNRRRQLGIQLVRHLVG